MIPAPRARLGGPGVIDRPDRTQQVVSFTAPNPWLARDLLRLGVSMGIALVGLGAAWSGAHDAETFNTQAKWVALGVAATSVAAAGGVSWLLTGLRAVRRLRGLLMDELRSIAIQVVDHRAGDGARAEFVTVPGGTRYHRADCLLVAGKRATPVLGRALADGDLRACGVCAC